MICASRLHAMSLFIQDLDERYKPIRSFASYVQALG